MGFLKTTTSIDLGDTPIENIFLDVYMPMANGTFVKVYLLAYKYACDKDMGMNVTNQTIANNLNIPLADVLSAWDFWEEKGIIKKIPKSSDDPWDYTVEFFSLKQLYIDNNYKSIQDIQSEKAEELEDTPIYTATTKDLLEANKIPEIKEMFRDINDIISRPLVPNEKMQILEWFQDYNIDPPFVVKAYGYCRYKKNVKNINYVSAVIRDWYDRGISTVEQLEEYLLSQGERYGNYSSIFRAMGFGSRTPSEIEIKIMNKWLDEYKYDMDIILKACENCSKTSNPNMNYIDKIVSNWYEAGVKTLEDVPKVEKIAKPNTSNEKTAPSISKVKTKFHLNNSRGSKYNADELEKLLLNRNKAPK